MTAKGILGKLALMALCGVVFLRISVPVRADNWMNRLPDEAYVAAISIPGAHDAATGSGWEAGYADLGDAFARTQELTLAEMWSAGIRAYDLRPCTRDGYLTINHGIIPTAMRFDTALRLLCDSLAANPSEFVIIHLLHESDGDQVDGSYNQLLLNVLNYDGLASFLVDFRRDLTVADVRGKMLILSRDAYASKPVGAFIRNWSHSADWSAMTRGQLTGASSTASATLYMQDYYETFAEGAMDTKIAAMTRLLHFSTTHATTSASSIRWVMNFASAYSLTTSLFGYTVSISDGYRDNASQTHRAMIDFLASNNAGPTGIVFMDYAGIDHSGDYITLGAQLTDAIIANNFGYLDDRLAVSRPIIPSASPVASASPVIVYSLTGTLLDFPRSGTLGFARYADGSVRKTVF